MPGWIQASLVNYSYIFTYKLHKLLILYWVVSSGYKQQIPHRLCLLLVKGLGFSSGPLPHKMGEGISCSNLHSSCKRYGLPCLHRGKMGRLMESYLGSLCPESCVKEAGKYGWPALATLVWVHGFCSRNIAVDELGRASGSALQPPNYITGKCQLKTIKCFLVSQVPYTGTGTRIQIF